MKLSFPKIIEAFPEFNRRAHTPLDFWQTIERRSIDVLERKQKKRGYYAADVVVGDFIFIDSRLKSFLWLDVAYHELTHALLHIPSPFLADKHQFEAKAFSLMMICPVSELDAGSEMRQAAKYNHVARYIIREREKIYFLHDDFRCL